MIENDKIYVSKYLNELNIRADQAIRSRRIKTDHLCKLTCKELAEKCNVTPATITNLTTSSKYILIYTIAGEILDAYYPLFDYEECQYRKENPDEFVYPRDINYVIMQLTTYWSGEWLS